MSNTSQQSTAADPTKIFLVEDNPGDVRLVREALKSIDHEVSLEVLTNGDDAINRLLQQDMDGEVPDLVLLDLNLPGRDGCAVLDAIRDDSTIKTLPVVMLSSSSTDDDIARCYDSKANAYLTKPGNLTELISMMKIVEDFWGEKAHLPPV